VENLILQPGLGVDLSSLSEFLSLKPFSILLFADTAGNMSTFIQLLRIRGCPAEVLAAVFGGGSGKVVDGQIEGRTGVVSPVFEN